MRGGVLRPPRSAAWRQGPIPRLDRCSLLRARERFQGLRRLFLQLEKSRQPVEDLEKLYIYRMYKTLARRSGKEATSLPRGAAAQRPNDKAGLKPRLA